MKLFLSVCALLVFSLPAMAQNAPLPDMPQPIQAMAERGAQVRYLGKDQGLDGWITIFQGQEQYFYVMPDGSFLMGLLFDKDGKAVTVEQVRQLQAQGGDVLDMFAADVAGQQQSLASAVPGQEAFEFQTPAQRMFTDVQRSNWVSLGNANAPLIYTFVDPQCGHCHAFLNDLRRDYIEAGRLQVRIIPVGFHDESLAQAAFLLAAPDAAKRWFDHLDGDENALPAKNTVDSQGVQKNIALMQAWKFDVTPISVYQSKSGEVKLIRGRAKDMEQILRDLAS